MPRHSDLNHEKNEKHKKRVPPTGQTAFKVVKTSSSKSVALTSSSNSEVAELQIAVSISCHSAVRSVDHLGEIMVTHGKGSNFMLFNNFAFVTRFGFFLGMVWLFFSKGVWQTWSEET